MSGPGRGLVGMVLGAALLASSPARATGFDISLAALVDPANPQAATDYESFRAIATDLGLTMQPRFAGPASTVGSLGFDVGYNYITTDLAAHQEAWSKTVEVPLDTLTVSQLHVRKGLPFSLELGCAVSRIHDSRLWGVAFEIKTAFVEGYTYVPDIGARTHISTVIGSRDLAMLGVGGDFLMSKSFGLFGVVKLTPYAGYSLSYVYARSHVVGRFYGTETIPKTATLGDQHLVIHRGLFGAALAFSALEVAFELARNDNNDTLGLRVGIAF